MRPTPGGGPSLLRLAAVNFCALGFGLTDGVFFHFMITTLMKAGESKLLAFSALAESGALAMLFAPMASAGSTSENRRAQITFLMLQTGALSCIGIGMVFMPLLNSAFANVPMWKAYISMALAALYRACVQASPVVPSVMDAALMRGDKENYPQRRDISLSFYYIEYRIGFVISSLAVALLPNYLLENIFPVMVTAAFISLLLTTISAAAFPYEHKVSSEDQAEKIKTKKFSCWDSALSVRVQKVKSDSQVSSTSSNSDQPKPPFRELVVEHLSAALFQGDRRLLAGYVETLYYGIAFGQLAAITPSFFNDTVFKNDTVNLQGARWASYVAITGVAIGVLVDGALPSMVFRKHARKFTMTVAWSCGAFFGAVLFFALIFVTNRWAALFLLSALYVTKSTHELFSLVSAGGLVKPEYRGTSFSVRAAAFNGGALIGTLMSGFVSGVNSWPWIMFHCSTACLASGLAAGFSGSVEREDYEGVAANVNELWKYVIRRNNVRTKVEQNRLPA